MQIKTIMNQIQRYTSFVYSNIRLVDSGDRMVLKVDILPRAGTQPACSKCKRKGPGYDTLSKRHFEFVPLWGIPVFFIYEPRRVNCSLCGVKVEHMPWAEGKHHITTTYAWFLSRWARRLNWKDVAEIFKTSWEQVSRSVEMAVNWGLEHRDLDNIKALGVDEIQVFKGHKYVTLVYQIDEHCRRLLWIGQERKAKTLLKFFRWFGKEKTAALTFICSDMWKPYLKVIAKKAAQALHVLDRFHIMSNMNKAINKVRSEEARRLASQGKDILKGSRWCLLKRPDNLTESQDLKLVDLLSYNLKTVRAYLLKEDFQFFWHYKSAAWAGKFLDRWCNRTMRSKIEPMKKMAKSLRKHRPLLLNWFRAKGTISAGPVEGLNGKAKLTMRKAYGYRGFRLLEMSLYHTLGKLPEPKFTHKFC